MSLPSDTRAPRFPVSVKGVILVDGRIPLLLNEREEWELPGGKLEPKESPPVCLEREIVEELGVQVHVERILDCWLYDILGTVEVVIVTYLCSTRESPDSLRISHEHKQLRLFSPSEIPTLNMPEGYKQSILACGFNSD